MRSSKWTAKCFLLRHRDPDEGKVPCCQELRELERITPIGLHSIRANVRRLRRSHDLTVIAQLTKLAAKAIACGPSLVADLDLARHTEWGELLLQPRQIMRNLTDDLGLSRPLGAEGDVDGLLVDVETDVCLYLLHGPASCAALHRGLSLKPHV